MLCSVEYYASSIYEDDILSIERLDVLGLFSCCGVVQDAQLSQRDRAAGCVIVFAKSSRLELGENNLWTL